jgi:alpha/beta superfamily hydrolase
VSVPEVIFNGPDGRLEGRYQHGVGDNPPIAVVLHPHPQHGGNMNNKVAYTLFQTFTKMGFCWVGGFSFGAWIALQLLMRRPEIDGFTTVSPPASAYDFSFLAPCPVSGQVIQGDADDVVPIDSVKKLVDKLSSQRDVEVDYRIVKGADHFFTNRMDVISDFVREYVEARLAAQSEEA